MHGLLIMESACFGTFCLSFKICFKKVMLSLKVLKLFLCSFDSVILILFSWKEMYFCLSKSLIQSVGSLLPLLIK